MQENIAYKSKNAYKYDGIDVYIHLIPYMVFGNVSVHVFESDEVPYATFSTNIDPLPKYHFAVDANNHPEAAKWLEDNNIAKPTGRTIKSGFCTYPVYAIDEDFVKNNFNPYDIVI